MTVCCFSSIFIYFSSVVCCCVMIVVLVFIITLFFFFKQKTAYEFWSWLEFRRVLFRSKFWGWDEPGIAFISKWSAGPQRRHTSPDCGGAGRSEERRVGKECGAGGARKHTKKEKRNTTKTEVQRAEEVARVQQRAQNRSNTDTECQAACTLRIKS